MKGGHAASRDIMQQVKELEASFETLKGDAQQRRKRLMQSYEAQHFLTEVREEGKPIFHFCGLDPSKKGLHLASKQMAYTPDVSCPPTLCHYRECLIIRRGFWWCRGLQWHLGEAERRQEIPLA